jgi:hypothetical protein
MPTGCSSTLFDIFVQRPPQGALAEQNNLGQSTVKKSSSA